jgi:hypothetical protein
MTELFSIYLLQIVFIEVMGKRSEQSVLLLKVKLAFYQKGFLNIVVYFVL